MKLSVVANPSKYEVREVLAKTIQWAERKSITLYIQSQICDETGVSDSDVIQKTDSMKNPSKPLIMCWLWAAMALFYTLRESQKT